jgi:two-component system sensor histidine kinase BarA
LAVVPLLVIALSIGGYMIHVRLVDAREALHERGDIFAANLAMATELALLTRDLVRLQTLCDAALRQPDVIWTAVYDADDQTLAECGFRSGHDDDGGCYKAPIGADGVRVDDFDPPNASSAVPPAIGWVEVHLSSAGVQARQRRILLTSLLIVVGGLLFSMAAALRIGSGISGPLLALSDALRRHRDGEEPVRIAAAGNDEIGDLANDFNRMAETLERSQATLREQVSLATNELRRTVDELTRKNAELRAAREAALEAGREKNEFLARMSHEIRTPLNAVIGFSRLLRADPGPRRIEEYTRTIDLAATQLLCVIDGVLSFTKLESGALELERLAFDPCDCIEDAVAMLSPAAHEKGLELALVLHRDIPPTLEGDVHRLTQVIINLLDNAIKFTYTGHVLVEAGYADGELRVAVDDSGIGMTPDQRGRLFQPFVQADSSVTRRFGGTGLGLVICERLVRQMGGTIGVDSRPGRGSRFHFSIPFDLPGARVGTGSASVPAPLLAGRKVLVYDRQPAQLRALRTALIGFSMQVHNVARPDRLAALLESDDHGGAPFELLLLGLDSDEAEASRLRRLLGRIRRSFGGPVLILVGRACWEVPAAGPDASSALGDIDWATKPIRRARLYQRLCRLLRLEPALAGGDADDGTKRPLLRGKRVLMVEDNAFNRVLLGRLLSEREIDVQEAGNGAEAIAAARQTRFDLILMDIHMPDLDGIEAARRIKTGAAAAGRRCPPIIAMSADVFAEQRTPKQDWPFDGVIVKPISDAALDQAMQRAFDVERNPAVASMPLQPSPRPAPGLPSGAADLEDQLRVELERLLRVLAQEIDAGDRSAIRETVHQLKGLCGLYARHELASAVGALEAAATEKPMQTLSERLRELRALVRASLNR